MLLEELKQANVSIHIIATGAGAGLQQRLWKVPGSSAYLSGCSFPYAPEEQAELLGFMPEHFCSEEAAVDLASAAYMKTYKFGGKKPIGIGITASVASEKIHRGDHRVFICVITDDSVKLFSHIFEKGMGCLRREDDGRDCDNYGFWMLVAATKIISVDDLLEAKKELFLKAKNASDATELARKRFFERPFFAANGKRFAYLPVGKPWALMPGAFNPPHEGHSTAADHVLLEHGNTVAYEVTTNPPHKEALSVQALLQRAKLLQGTDRLFTENNPLYLDKAKAFPGIPLVVGADAMIRMLDPKWGVDPLDLLNEFIALKTKLLVMGRTIDGKFVSCQDILDDLRHHSNKPEDLYGVWAKAMNVLRSVDGRVDMSSTWLRNQVK